MLFFHTKSMRQLAPREGKYNFYQYCILFLHDDVKTTSHKNKKYTRFGVNYIAFIYDIFRSI